MHQNHGASETFRLYNKLPGKRLGVSYKKRLLVFIHYSRTVMAAFSTGILLHLLLPALLGVVLALGGFVVGALAQGVRSGWRYPLGALAGLACHLPLFFIFLAVVDLSSGRGSSTLAALLTFLVVIAVAPLVGLASAFAGRRKSPPLTSRSA